MEVGETQASEARSKDLQLFEQGTLVGVAGGGDEAQQTLAVGTGALAATAGLKGEAGREGGTGRKKKLRLFLSVLLEWGREGRREGGQRRTWMPNKSLSRAHTKL
jgi:hypothetical protein